MPIKLRSKLMDCDLEDQAERLNQNNEFTKVNYENRLTQLTSSKDLEKERAVPEVERKYQEQLQEVHDHYNEKIIRLYEKFEVDRD